ncbi:hypothetical protein NP493_50g00023 [Ridgeia piscesae]|uniref:Uncharacterized protein n=1 Tax=Ridgeia piscesae TaxID=27915 RepID=A0AAD9PBH6_RIDPI|nr:hypothetical protein NP493_50g00023 [Ridgeia piscesae]
MDLHRQQLGHVVLSVSGH